MMTEKVKRLYNKVESTKSKLSKWWGGGERGEEREEKRTLTACSVDWFVSLLVRKEVLLAGLCERKMLFQLEIYDRLRQATAKRT